MSYFILVTAIFLSVNYCQAQRKQQADTLETRFPNHNKVSGDTVFFKYVPVDLSRFFLRNLRLLYGAKGYEFGYCTLFFVVDTSGTVTKTWCEKITNDAVAKEAIRVTNKLSTLKPTYIKGKPVITKVKATIALVDSEKITDADKQTDIWLMAYPVRH